MSGPAGTGKTFLIAEIIKTVKIKNIFTDIIILAPTNDAVKVLRKSIKENINLTEKDKDLDDYIKNIQTIHSFFELRMKIDENGNQIFDTGTSARRKKIKEDTLFIIDEASMVSKDLIELIKHHLDFKLKRSKVMCLFTGDEYQLPPVKEDKSLVFDENEFEIIKLTEIIRQKNGNPIINLTMELRDLITLNKKEHVKFSIDSFLEKHLSVDKDHLEVIEPNEFNISNIEFFKDMFNGESVVGGFTNKVVNEYNNYLRYIDFSLNSDLIVYENDNVKENEKIIIKKPSINIHPGGGLEASFGYSSVRNETKSSMFHIGDVVEIKQIMNENILGSFIKNTSERINDLIMGIIGESEGFNDLTYDDKVKTFQNAVKPLDYLSKINIIEVIISDSDESAYTIKTPLPKSSFFSGIPDSAIPGLTLKRSGKFLLVDRTKNHYFDFQTIMNNLASSFSSLKKRMTFGDNRNRKMKEYFSKLWKEYYNINDLILDYGFKYSMTIHKLQGKTVDKIYIDLNDMDYLRIHGLSDKNKMDFYLRLLYVACTRPKHKIFFIKNKKQK